MDNARAPVYLPAYKLGDEGKPEYFNADASREVAAAEAKELVVGDAAFIKRSDLKWTYAILTERSEGDSVVLRFEVDPDKNRKSFPESQWGKYIRVIHVDEAELAKLKVEAGDMVAPDEEKVEVSVDDKSTHSVAKSTGEKSSTSIKSNKPSSFFGALPSFFGTPKKDSKKVIATEAKPVEATKEAAPVVEITEEETKPIEEVNPVEKVVPIDSTEIDHSTIAATISTVMFESDASIKKESKSIFNAIFKPTTSVAPDLTKDEPDNTKENSDNIPVVEAPKDDDSVSSRSLRSPLGLKKTGSLLNKFSLSPKKDKAAFMPTESKAKLPVLFEQSPATTRKTVSALGDASPKASKASDEDTKEWFDTEAWEVDYDTDPTDLFQALEAREFGYSFDMYKQVPLQFNKECKTWVVARGKQKDQLRFRALPLHAALVFGAPVELVKKILNAYPLAARGRDVKGRLPIHLAMEHNASEELVGLIIEAFPKGMLIVDKKNMTPLDYINNNTTRVYMKKYLPQIIAAKVEVESAKWEAAQAGALAAQRLAMVSDTEFMKPIVEAVTQDVENVYASKLSLVEDSYKKEMEAMKKKFDSETQALLDGFEVKLKFERKLQKMKGSAQ